MWEIRSCLYSSKYSSIVKISGVPKVACLHSVSSSTVVHDTCHKVLVPLFSGSVGVVEVELLPINRNVVRTLVPVLSRTAGVPQVRPPTIGGQEQLCAKEMLFSGTAEVPEVRSPPVRTLGFLHMGICSVVQWEFLALCHNIIRWEYPIKTYLPIRKQGLTCWIPTTECHRYYVWHS